MPWPITTSRPSRSFEQAGQSARFFDDAHGYTVFRAIGSGGQHDAATASPGYYRGMAVFTEAKGGLMHEASVSGQRFSYRPL